MKRSVYNPLSAGQLPLVSLRSRIHRHPQAADLGVDLTLEPPTRNMVQEAAGMGTLDVSGFAPRPRIQIVTVEDALARGPAAVDAPLRHGDTYRAAPREADPGAQPKLL